MRLPLPHLVLEQKEIRLDWLLTGAILLAFLILYAATMPKGPVAEADVSEFEFIGKVFGTPHPTGYPLYVSLCGLFVRLVPFGSIALRANLLTALCSAAALAVLFRTLSLLGAGMGPSLTAVVILGTTPLYWSQALVAEVYSLNLLLVASIVHVFIRWLRTHKTGTAIVGMGLYCLALGNHLSLICLLPALGLTLLCTRPSILGEPATWGWIALFILLGASQYLLVFLRARDPSTAFVYAALPGWHELHRYITGQQFWGSMFSAPWKEVVGGRLPEFSSIVLLQYGWSVPLILVGIVTLSRRREGLLILPAILAYLFFELNYAIGDIDQYYGVVFYLSGICLGLGLTAILRLARVRRLGFLAVISLLIALPIQSVKANVPKLDRHGEGRSRALSTIAALKSIEEPCVILSDSWTRSTLLWYLEFCTSRCAADLYVVHHLWPKELAAYCAARQGYYLPETRQTIPRGLPVYAFGKQNLGALQAQGLRVFHVRKELYLITVDSVLPPRIAARFGLDPKLRPVSCATYQAGWLPQEWWGVWAIAPSAVARFPARSQPSVLRISASCWTELPACGPCRVTVNGQLVGVLRFDGKPWQMREYDLPLPELRGDITVVLKFPPDSCVEDESGIRRYLPVHSIDLMDSPRAHSIGAGS